MDTDDDFNTDVEEHETSGSDSERQSEGEEDSVGRVSFHDAMTAATDDSRYAYILIHHSMTSCLIVTPEKSTCLFPFLQFEP